jgi:hypothetical protein
MTLRVRLLFDGQSMIGEIINMADNEKRFIAKDEIWNWMCSTEYTADAKIPAELHAKLTKALAIYADACQMINKYLLEHKEDNIKY